MGWKRACIVVSLILAAGPATAETYMPRGSMMLLFNEARQKHPKVATFALPITGPVIANDAGKLSFSAGYVTNYYDEEDNRNSKGKVILKVQVVRDDEVIWRKKKKSKIKDDRTPAWPHGSECGNCTHKLKFRNKFKGDLQEADLVLFQFKFRKMPRFEPGESAELGGEVTD